MPLSVYFLMILTEVMLTEVMLIMTHLCQKSFKTLANGVPNFSLSPTLGQNKLEFFYNIKRKKAVKRGWGQLKKTFHRQFTL
jgi:hypothetical protein